ncbi:MAG: hypothetical protein HWQ38_00260 [Nostoc sp. NMS7]|nr:hypothetical protein [Nostoc sp. NMS7]
MHQRMAGMARLKSRNTCGLMGIKQKLCPNKAQTGDIRSKQVTMNGQPVKRSTHT